MFIAGKLLLLVGVAAQCARAPKVAIVGAGMAGLAAAEKLLDDGRFDLTIIEARDRVGGRILTKPRDGLYLEMGPKWMVFTQQTNEFYQRALAKNLIADFYNDEEGNGPPNYYKFNGQKVHKDSAKHADGFIIDSEEEIAYHFADNYQQSADEKWTIGQFLEDKWNTFVTTNKWAKRYRADYQAVYEAEKRRICIDLGSSNLSVHAHNQADFGDSGAWLLLKSGYGSIVSQVLNIPASVIKLNSEVINIDYTDGIQITYEDTQSGVQSQMQADYVIATPTIGYLQAHMDTLFTPALSARKQQAINSIEMGGVGKIFVKVETPFWSPQDLKYSPAWAPGGANTFENDPSDWSNNVAYCEAERQFAATTNDWISAWVFGTENARRMELDSDAEVERKLKQVMAKFTSNPINVLDMVRSEWVNDPLALGAYSVLPLSSAGSDDRWWYGEPVRNQNQAPIVLFAGEAASIDKYATVVGAYESGQKQAALIIENEDLGGV